MGGGIEKKNKKNKTKQNKKKHCQNIDIKLNR